MAIAQPPPPATGLLTYETYLAEGSVEGRYNIIEGVREFMPGATWGHQRIAGNLSDLMRHYERTRHRGLAIFAPFDILIRTVPRLQTRQPDVFFISNEQLTRGGGVPQRGYLVVAPELVIEVISDSETDQRFDDKRRDYGEIGVRECWRVRQEARMIDVLRLAPDGCEVVATYGENESVQSLTFPDLIVPVAAVFAA